jgi:predicted transcriptional regulator
MITRKKMSSITILFTLLLVLIISPAGFALKTGATVNSIKIRDANNNPAYIPGIGKKVLTIFYADPDVSDVNDPLADALKARKFSKTLYKGMGIANLADTGKPNFIIRMVIRRKIKKYKSTILTDVDKTVAKTWNLGSTNGFSIVIVIGKDKKVKYIEKVKTEAQSRAIIGKVISIIEKELKK